jgi:hypothetical protein
MEEVDKLIAALRKASYKERDPIKQELLALARGPQGAAVRDRIENARRGELLEVQWELEEVLEATAPKKAEPPKKVEPPAPPEAPPDPNRPLTSKDLVLVYDDPRGLMLHKAKVGERWFATQFDQRSGQPQTFELHPTEVAQLKTQLANSPYWVIGAAGVPAGAGGPAPGGLGGAAPKPAAPMKPGPRR